MALSQVVFDLAARPKYIKGLREEIKEVLAEDGYDIDGEGFTKLKKSSYTKLRKLDSFLKESQRLSPPGISSSPYPLNLPHFNKTFSFHATHDHFPPYPLHRPHHSYQHPICLRLPSHPLFPPDHRLLP